MDRRVCEYHGNGKYGRSIALNTLMKKSLAALKKHHLFAPLIEKYGAPRLRRGATPFQALARAIIYQQISGKAAASIYKKFVGLYSIDVTTPIDWESKEALAFPTPQQILETPVDRLRSAGLSSQKAAYLIDLAQTFSKSGPHDALHTLENEEVIKILTQIKGIGVWTVQMFLIFNLGRVDVLPTGDLGIQRGFQRLYRLRTPPTKEKMEKFAHEWREHASVASWYLWRLADEPTNAVPQKSPPKKQRPRAKSTGGRKRD